MPRCPNGSRRNKKTGKCDKISKSYKVSKNCPKGSKLNLKTNRCNKIKSVQKKCADGKILNPKTNRCIKNSTSNKKKFNLPGIINSIPSLINPPNTNPSPYKSYPYIIDQNCKKYENIKDCDIDKITIDKVKSNKTQNNYKIMYKKKEEFDKIKFLNKGVYGEVFKYSNKNYEIAIKKFNSNKDSEIKIIRMLKKIKIPCNIINSKLLKYENEYMAAMDLMNGPLSEIGNKLNNNNLLQIIKSIAKILLCLENNKLSYTDLKTANILFKCIDNKNIKIVLGDIGSICQKGKQNAATWLPWEARYLKGFPRCNEESMVWGLGIVLFQLLNFNTDPFHWSKIYKLKTYEIQKIINLYSSNIKVNNLTGCKILPEKLIKSMLDLNPKKRMKLKTIIDNIN